MNVANQACIVRPYQPVDLIPICDLWYRAWHEEHPGTQHIYPIEKWRERFQAVFAATMTIWVATIDAIPVGYVVIVPAQCRIDHIIVEPTHRRKGIGSRLIEQCKRTCPNGLTVTIAPHLAPARAFYESNDLLQTATILQWRPTPT
jgi:GNAT superfamily N-acetyltransferase